MDTLISLWRTLDPIAIFGLIMPVALLIFFFVGQTSLQVKANRKNAHEGASYRSITKAPSDNGWLTIPALEPRPFTNPTPQVTSTTDFSSFLSHDKTYKERIQSRRATMKSHSTASIAATKASWDSVAELYEWLFGTYLPQRYPDMFILMAPSPQDVDPDAKPTGRGLFLRNRVTAESISVTAPEDPMKALAALGAHVDADFVFLVPRKETGKYYIEGFVACCPAGYDLKAHLGKTLGEVGTGELGASLEEFFGGLPNRLVVQRESWAVSAGKDSWDPDGEYVLGDLKDVSVMHENYRDAEGMRALSMALRAEEDGLGGGGAVRFKVDVNDCRLRCERQTVHRLPETNGLVFAFKTYQSGLDEIKSEGKGEELASAIEGLKQKADKRNGAWISAVKEYLRK